MKIEILEENGFKQALFGMGLSYDLTAGISYLEFLNDPRLVQKLYETSLKLYNKDGGHNKFLESCGIILDVNAPRYWWQEADTYRVGTTKQSQSTIHTIMRNEIVQGMFEEPVDPLWLSMLGEFRVSKNFSSLKNMLPEGFLQRRIWCLNYKVLRNILQQRQSHKLPQWRYFCSYIRKNVDHPEYFNDIV